MPSAIAHMMALSDAPNPSRRPRRGRTASGAVSRAISFSGVPLCGMATDRLLSITPIAIYRDPGLSDSAKVVAGGIGMFMNRSGRCWPGTPAIAAELHKSIATVERGIAALKARKHLTVTRRQRDTAILEWMHPLTPQLVTDQTSLLIPQSGGLDPSEKASKGPLDPSRHKTRARIERGQLTSSIERGEQPGQNDRDQHRHRHTPSSEQPVQDLDHRERPALPTSLAAFDWRKVLTKPSAPLDNSGDAGERVPTPPTL